MPKIISTSDTWCVIVAQSCPTLSDPVDCSLPSSSVHGILQARILDWVAISFSRGTSDPGIEPGSPALQADSLPFEPPGKPSNFKIICFLFLVVLYFHCCPQAFSSCGKWELFSSCGAWTSHCGGFSCCEAQALGTRASVAAAQGF